MNINEELFDFIKSSPSPFHAVTNIANRLEASGAKRLCEGDKWNVKCGETYFVTRNNSSIIAVKIPEKIQGGFMITAAHSDSPTFKIKDNPELEDKNYIRVNTERYGGMILDSWFDRPLSVAGRLLLRTGNGIMSRLVSTDKLLLIPRVAIHMNNSNEKLANNPAVDLVPLYGTSDKKGTFMKKIADSANVCEENIIGHDLYLVNEQEPTVWGADNEFISSPKLDDLQCAFSATSAFVLANPEKSISVLFVADNEEVGSQTKQGAGSTFLNDVLSRIAQGLGFDPEDFKCMISRSMLLSADNAHAVHPNHGELADPTNRPVLNGGVVMKYNAAQHYTTDGVSAAIFREICKNANVKLQTFCNRSDMRGGSTLGNISNTQLSMNAVDIGIAQLAMHSSYETAGAFDTEQMILAMKEFFSTSLNFSDENVSIVH